MQLALSRPLDWRRLGHRALLVSLVTVNVIGLLITAGAFLNADVGVDLRMYQLVGERAVEGGCSV